MARVRSAWWPGGRIAEKAFLASPVITSSTACTAAPTPRSTASNVPGDMVVSASMRDHAVARRHLLDRLHVGGRMGELGHRRGAERRLLADEPGETLVLERPIDRPDTVGALGMARRRLVIQRGGMAQKKRRHASASVLGTRLRHCRSRRRSCP